MSSNYLYYAVRSIAYREYDSETGELVGVGSEDFSQARWKSEIEGRFIWTWDGERRNKVVTDGSRNRDTSLIVKATERKSRDT